MSMLPRHARGLARTGQDKREIAAKPRTEKTWSRNACSHALEGMHATSLCLAATLLLASSAHAADDSDTQIRAALTASGEPARLIVRTGGKKPAVKLWVGTKKPVDLYLGEAAATLEAGHGRVLIAVSIDSAKKPFQIVMLDR